MAAILESKGPLVKYILDSKMAAITMAKVNNATPLYWSIINFPELILQQVLWCNTVCLYTSSSGGYLGHRPVWSQRAENVKIGRIEHTPVFNRV